MSEAIGVDLTANDASPQFTPGTVISLTDDGVTKSYKYVQYNAATADIAGVAGEVAAFTTVAVGGATGHVVTSDYSDSLDIGAGVLQAALTDDYYGWIQVTGPATLTIALDSGADGDALTTDTATTDGSLGVTTALTDSICAYAIDVSAKVIMCDFPH